MHCNLDALHDTPHLRGFVLICDLVQLLHSTYLNKSFEKLSFKQRSLGADFFKRAQ
jgi:hypothetical protein